MGRGSREERQRLLIEEVKSLLKSQGKSLDPEMLAKLTGSQGGVVEDNASRFAEIWRAIRVPFTLFLLALFALLFFFLIAH